MGKRAGLLVEVGDRLGSIESGMKGLAGVVASAGLSSVEVGEVLARLRRVERLLVGVVCAGTKVAACHEAAGGPHVEDVLGAGDEVSKPQAREQRERAELLERFPALSEGLIGGEARPVNVDVLARMCRQMTDEELAVLVQQDTKIAAKAANLGEESFRKTVTRMRDRIRRDGGESAAERATKDQFARVAPTRDRTAIRFAALLDGENGDFAQAALNREFRRLNRSESEASGLDGDQTMARAFANLLLRGDQMDPSLALRPQVTLNVLVDRDTIESGTHDDSIMETFDGVAIPPSRAALFGCDGVLRRLDTLPDGSVHVSHSGRTATAAQRAALRALDPVCPLDGSPWSQIEVHHTVHYETSGRTVLSELVPISRRWHHRIHDAGWRVELGADRTLFLYRPDGTLDRTIAPPVPVNQAASSWEEVAMAA